MKFRSLPPGVIIYWLSFAMLVFLFSYKVIIFSEILEKITGCSSCFYKPILLNDAVLIGSVLFAFFLLILTDEYKIFSVLIKISVILFGLIYLTDVLIAKTFATRLFLEDIKNYGFELKAGLSFIQSILARSNHPVIFSTTLIILTGLIALIIGIFILTDIRIKKKIGKWGLIASGALFAVSFFQNNSNYVHSWAIKNFVDINLTNSAAKPYSFEFKNSLLTTYPTHSDLTCQSGLNQKPNIIILIVESLSSYQSSFFSGLNPFTPNIDAIAASNMAFTDFYANGYKSEHGLIAILLGKHPIPAPQHITNPYAISTKNNSEFIGYDNAVSLPRILTAHDYQTYFFTTAYLNYAGWNAWLENIGFRHIEDGASAAYANEAKFNFGGAADEALFKRVLNSINQINRKSPFFMVVETVSTHHPFINPEGGPDTEESVFRYTDQQIRMFYDELERMGFFNNGILFITGDHRAMTPISRSEIELFGHLAPARIPLIVATRNPKQVKKIEKSFQQTDIFTSIRYVIEEKWCRSPDEGNFFSDPITEPDCIYHYSGDEREFIHVSCDQQDASVKLDGDATRIITGKLSQDKRVVDYINFQRISR